MDEALLDFNATVLMSGSEDAPLDSLVEDALLDSFYQTSGDSNERDLRN